MITVKQGPNSDYWRGERSRANRSKGFILVLRTVSLSSTAPTTDLCGVKKKLFRTSSTTRHMKIAKKIDVMHYNTITRNRRTGSVFRKENLADITCSEAKHCSFHLVAKVMCYIRQVCLPRETFSLHSSTRFTRILWHIHFTILIVSTHFRFFCLLI
jgi:hypothetical protein